MCLDKITKRYKANRKVVVAYKEFRQVWLSPSTLRFRYRDGVVKRGVWLRAKGHTISYATTWDAYKSRKIYPAGFHAWKTPQLDLGEEKVLLRGVRTQGHQWGRLAIVADWLYVPKLNERITPEGRIVKIKKEKGH